MNRQTIRQPPSQATIRWAFAGISALCWSYALAVRFSSFSIASRANKTLIIGLLLILTGSLAAWLFHDLLPKVCGPLRLKAAIKSLLIGIIAASALLLVVYQPPPFPEHHLLEIYPHPSAERGRLEVVSIHRVELPGKERLEVPPGVLDIQGNWQTADSGNALIWSRGADAVLSYARLMQAGMEITFRSGPMESGARVVWDGQEYILNLHQEEEGQYILRLAPALDIRRADLTRQLLVASALLAELLGLALAFSILGTLFYQVLWVHRMKMRAVRPMLLCLLALGMLLITVYHINPVASFPDIQLELVVRETLGQREGPIYQNALRTIADLDASGRGIVSVEGIEQLRNLVSLNLRGNHIEDLAPLGSLKRLKTLNLRENAVRDLTPLITLSNLEYLNLHSNYRIESIEPLKNLRQLQMLILAHVPVGDEVEELANLGKLRYLNLRDSDIVDLSDLAGLNHLEHLNLHSNHRIQSITPLQNLTKLQTLILRDVPVGDEVSVLAGMTMLVELNLRATGIRDLQAIGQLMASGALQDQAATGRAARLDLRDNPIAIPLIGNDPYAPLRPYWENVFYRLPFGLPPVQISPPAFSREGGFYPEEFDLTLTTDHPGAHIYYTLDGSEPDMVDNPQNTYLYETPIRITRHDQYRLPVNPDDPTKLTDLLEYGARVIRAISVTSDQVTSPVATHTYFVDANFRQNYQLPVVSIATDPLYLYAYEDGIYVKGMVYDDTEDIFWERYPKESAFNHPANYHQRGQTYLPISGIEVEDLKNNHVAIHVPDHGLALDFNYHRTAPLITIRGTAHYDGDYYLSPDSDRDTLVIQKRYKAEVFPPGAQIIRDWERAVHMEFFENGGQLAFSQSLGMRIHGGASRASSQKSLRFYARLEYDQVGSVQYRLFPDDETENYQRFLLRLTNSRSGLNDVLGQQFMKAVHPPMDIQRYRPVMVFINGDFWGWYSLRDRYDDHYLANLYGIHPLDVAYLRGIGQLKYGRLDDVEDYLELDAFIRTADLSDEANFALVESQMDVDNYTAWMLTGIYLNYRDWGQKHHQYWRYTGAHPGSDAPAELDGRWRWLPIDLDLAMVRGAQYEYLSEIIPNEGYYLHFFLTNPTYKTDFISRFADMINTVFREEAAVERVQELADELPERAINESIARWNSKTGINDWYAEVEQLERYLQERPTYMRQHIVDYFDLEGMAILTLSANNQGGTIRVNTITLAPDTPGMQADGQWGGIYFKGIPVTIQAIPNPGYRFSNWEGIENREAIVALNLQEDMLLKAIFVPITD